MVRWDGIAILHNSDVRKVHPEKLGYLGIPEFFDEINEGLHDSSGLRWM
jgi:hypothetical protein